MIIYADRSDASDATFVAEVLERFGEPAPESWRPACDAMIFPSWSNRWVQCGAALINGRCAKYGAMHDRANGGDS